MPGLTLPVTFVPGEASIVAVATMVTEALKLTQAIIADQTEEEKAELAKGRVQLLRMVNTFGQWILERLQQK